MKKEIVKFSLKGCVQVSDDIAAEEPLEVVIEYMEKGERIRKTIAITMRSPGADFDLARGFLFTENIVSSWEGIELIAYDSGNGCTDTNKILVRIRDKSYINLPSIDRNFYTTSSCGICGKTGIEAVRAIGSFLLTNQKGLIRSETLLNLSETIFSGQDEFQKNGGIHAASLYNFKEKTILLREDVGRHNAMDKALGALSLMTPPPFSYYIAFVSGRISFELVQKAYLAGIPVIAAFGAPTSLAVDFAEETGMTLIGFLKKERFNIYTAPSRIIFE